MLARSLNGSDRKSAAQRSRDLFSSLAGGDRDRPGLISRIRAPRDVVEPVRDAFEETLDVPANEIDITPPVSAALATRAVAASEPTELAQTEPDKVETSAAKIRRLQAEAQALAREEVARLERQIAELAQAARQIAEGGDAYPVGAREVARRLAEEMPRQGGVLEALLRKL